MKHRLPALTLATALAAGPLAMTATAAAAWTPASSASTATAALTADTTEIDSVETGREIVPEILERTKERRDRARAGLAADTPQGAERLSAQSAESMTALATGRIAGDNRFETSALISQDSHPDPASDFGGIVFIANGLNFPDALAAGPAATSMLGPVLLVSPTGGLPESVRDEIVRLQPDSAVILGQTDNVGVQVETELQQLIDPTGVFRAAGTNRNETSAILSLFVTNYDDAFNPIPLDTAIISTGATFADALAGGAAGGWEYAPLFLTGAASLDPAVAAALAPIPADPANDYPGQEITTVRILGSTATLSTTVQNQIQALLPNADVIRYSGANRFDTASRLNADVFTAPSFEITMANGLRFPDALAGAPRVNKTGGPTVPVLTACVPTESVATLTTFTPTNITALGKTDAVSDAALSGASCG
ncbi:MAG: cell wall-binding repeat-containing protein [Dermatophilaceae bacterium]